MNHQKKSQMLECMINFYTNGNKSKFAEKLGVTPQTISSWLSRETFDAELIFAKCENISAEWLLSGGEGEMLVVSPQSISQENSEIISLCRAMVANYKQRDEIIRQLSSIIQ